MMLAAFILGFLRGVALVAIPAALLVLAIVALALMAAFATCPSSTTECAKIPVSAINLRLTNSATRCALRSVKRGAIPMTALTLGAAARESGKSKSTLWRAIKRGSMSATRTADGDFLVEPSELFRAYPKPIKVAPGATLNGAVLEAELSGARALIAALESRITDLLEQRDAWRDQATAIRLLVDQRGKSWKPWNLLRRVS